MASANAGPITGSELLRVIQNGKELRLTRAQVQLLLARTQVDSLRPGRSQPTSLTGNETFRFNQGGTNIRMNVADFNNYLASSASPDAVLGKFRADVLTGAEYILGGQGMVNVDFTINETNTALGIAPNPAPVFTTAPSISPSSGTAGSTLFTANDGVSSNTTSKTRRWLLSGVQVAGNVATYTPSSAGSLAIEVTATGPGGDTIASSPSATVSASSATAPSAPSLVVTAGNGQNTVTWTDGANGGSPITSRKLYRSTTSGFTPGSGNLIVTDPTLPDYVDTGLTNGTTYYYKGVATNIVNDSPASTQASGTPSAGISSMSLQRNTAPAGASRGYNVGNLNGTPTGQTPVLAANTGNYVVSGSEANGWEIVAGATPAPAGVHALTISAPGTPNLVVNVTATAYAPAAITWLDAGAVAVYSMVKVGTYTGNYVTLRREGDDDIQSFGVAADNIVDRAAIDTWRGASDARVKQLWDTSGAGFHAVQTDPAKQPLWVSNDIWTGKLPCLQFDKWKSGGGTQQGLEAVAPTGWNIRNFSAIFGMSNYAGGNWFVGKYADGNYAFKLAATARGMVVNASEVTTIDVPRSNPMASAISNSDQSAGSGLRKLYYNDAEVVISSPSVANAIDGKLLIGDPIGANAGFSGDFYFFALYPTTPKLNTAINPMLAGMRTTFQFVSNYTLRVGAGGDSIEAGQAVVYNRTRWREMVRQGVVPTTTEWVLIPVPGQTVATAATANWAKLYRADIPTILTSNIGQNSIGSTVAAQDTTYGQLTTMINNMNATGAKSLIYTTVPNRASGDAYSQWIARERQNNAGATAILDLTQTKPVGQPTANTDLAYYQDGIHPTALANSINARAQGKAITAVFNGETGLVVYQHAMNFSTIPTTAAVGAAATGGVSGSGGVAPYAWTIYSGALPTGITLNSTTGQLQGTFTTAGTFTFIIRQTDASGLTVNSVQLQIVVS